MRSDQEFCVGDQVFYTNKQGSTSIYIIIDESLVSKKKTYDLCKLTGENVGLKVYWVKKYELVKVK